MNHDHISGRTAFLYHLQRNLRLLQSDLDLREQGYKYFFVVDFSAIFAYSYKTYDKDAVASIPDEDEARIFARQHAALSLIFDRESFADPLLLIPPYAAELKNHLNLIRIQVRLATLDLNKAYRERLATVVERSEEFRNFMRLRSVSPGQVAIDQSVSAALKVGKLYFPELYLLANSSADGMRLMRQLFQRAKLKDSELLIPELKGFEYSTDPALIDSWYDIIRLRRPVERAYQSFIDAMACAYVEKANKLLNPNKRIIVFVAPSAHVSRALRGKPMIELESERRLDVTRDLTYFLLLLVHDFNSRHVANTLNTVNELLDVYQGSFRVGSSFVGQTEKLVERMEFDWRQCENLFLMTEVVLGNHADVGPPPSQRDAAFLSLLQKIHTAAGSESDRIKNEVKTLLRNIKDETDELDKAMPASPTIESLGEIKLHPLSTKTAIVFPAFNDETPTVISLGESGMRDLAKRLSAFSEGKSSAQFEQLRQSVLELASGIHATPEQHLLAGYILALEAKYQAALDQLNAGLRRANGEERAELLYLSAVLWRKVHHPVEAGRDITEALARRPDEPRYLIEAATITWMQAYYEAQGGLIDFVSKLNVAINLARSALDKHKSGDREMSVLEIQIENVLAFLLTERALLQPRTIAEDLREAGTLVGKMERMLPEKRWTSRLYDTRAWWNYACALGIGTSHEKEERLKSALADIVQALGWQQTVQERKLLLEKHRGAIMTALREL
jgi:hypothetical protein